MKSLICLTEKKIGIIKGATLCSWMTQEEVSSPKVSTEATLLTAVIEAEEGGVVATCDIPNALIQTVVEER